MVNKKLCVGVVGAGAISEVYLNNMIKRFGNLLVKSICAKHIENAEKKAEEHGITAVTYKEMLMDEEIDIIVNLTPVSAHYEIIKAALEHGKHVYTEKILTEDIKKSEELLALAVQNHLYLASAPDTFFGGAFQRARSAIDEGLIGAVNSFAISANRNNNILLSGLPYLREPGNGIVYDYAVYYVTALVSLFGPVARVGSSVRTPYPKHVNCLPDMPGYGQVIQTPNESQLNAVLQLRSGITGTLHIDADNIFSDQAWFMVYGTNGTLLLTNPDHFEGQVKLVRQSCDLQKGAEETLLWNFSPYMENCRGVGVSDLADAIVDRRRCRTDGKMAFHVQEALHAMLMGGTEGQFEDISSVCERPEPLKQMKVPVNRLAHVAYNVKNMDRMLEFYKNVLGMKELFTLTIRDLYDTITGRWKEMGEEFAPDQEEKIFVENLESIKDEKWIVYLKLADRQYLELFYDVRGFGPENKMYIRDRKYSFGFRKMNFETKDIRKVKARFMEAGVSISEDIHRNVKGSEEFTAYDPEGNEVQFIQYSQEEARWLAMKPDAELGSCSFAECTTQVAYAVKDDANMRDFYTKGLGLRMAGRLTYADLAEAMQNAGAPEKELSVVKMKKDAPWIDYIEISNHQYLELFYDTGTEGESVGDLSGYYGYQHISIEVDDIENAWNAVVSNGLKPDSGITLGCDGAYQFWLTDPDGNRLELHCYTDRSKQLV